MANLKDLRAKISSTKKTQQTTRAMKMVSAAKLRRAQDSVVNARPYALKLRSFIQKLASCPEVSHPLLDSSPIKGKTLLLVLTSDRGLCGGFNSGINKYTVQYASQKSKNDFDVIFLGKRGADFFRKRDFPTIDEIHGLAKTISFDVAQEISERVLKSYLGGEYSEVRIIYNEFKSAISQEVIDERLLPVSLEGGSNEDYTSTDFIFEPSIQSMLDELLRKHFAIQVFRCLQESVASEHGARMSAMENATKNAGEMISSLTLNYNKLRQAKITTELIEITSGAEAL